MTFSHLHCHSAFSLLEGTARTQALVTAARRLKMPALALTDRNNLYSAVHFYTQAQKVGIKPIIGMEVDLEDGSSLVLLARNMDGYRNLCHLSSALRLTAPPEIFPPSGFEDEDDEILPWDPGLWGVPLFGVTHKPPKLPKLSKLSSVPQLTAGYINSKLKIQNSKLPLEAVFSGRHVRGLIALSGGPRGLVNRLVAQGKTHQAARVAGMLLAAFGEGNFFIEVTACTEHDRNQIQTLATLANDLSIPLVATNDVLYIEGGDAVTAAALAAVRDRTRKARAQELWTEGQPGEDAAQAPPTQDSKLRTHDLHGRHFATPAEMEALFSEYPQAIANTGFIAEGCNVELTLHRPIFPGVDLKGKGETSFSRLWKLCFAGATRRYKPLTEAAITRLKYELEVIERLGFSPYFLVVQDIAHFARRKGIPIMARGSAANSLVAYVLNITQVDPLAHDLLFERFLNPSRAEIGPQSAVGQEPDGNAATHLPDIDLDLCWRRRDEVLHYVYDKYGRDHVAIVGTHITFRLRSAWREMARVVGIHPDRISYIASRLPHLFSTEDILEGDVPELEGGGDTGSIEGVGDQGSGVTIYGVEETLSLSPDPRPLAPEISAATVATVAHEAPKLRDSLERQAFDLCKAVEGLPRYAGMHCAGVVITPGPIADLVPLQRAARDPSMAITQYEKGAIEALGLVKIDLLGSRALTTLVDSLQAVGLAKGGGGDVHAVLDAIPFDDAATYRMLAQGDTLGCFQLESPGMRGLLKWLRPQSMTDIAAAISLFRPGPMEGGFLEIFMRRHLRQEPVTYPHPSMEPILRSTHGVILYQEQFLRLAHTLGGLDLGDAEKLRKEIGKAHSPEERTRLGSRFVAGAIERGVDQMQAERVWEVIAGYSGFGFCQAHAYSYALTAYRSAYMKAHYPAQYMAAQINNQGGYYGTGVYVEDARRLGIRLLPPHINLSGAFCEGGPPPYPSHPSHPSHPSRPSHTRQIRFGLQFVKGLSERTISLLLSERRAHGPFGSLQDILLRVEMSQAEAASLIKVGACEDLGSEIRGQGSGSEGIEEVAAEEVEEVATLEEVEELVGGLSALNRKQMLVLLPMLVNTRKPRSRSSATASDASTYRASGQGPRPDQEPGAGRDRYAGPLQLVMDDFLVGNLVSPRILGSAHSHLEVPEVEDFTLAEKLRLEQKTLGFTVSHNEMELYAGVLDRLNVVPGHALPEYAGHKVTVAGVIAAGRRHLAKDGEWMLFVSLQDRGCLIEAVLFPDVYKAHGALIANNGYGPYLVTGTVQVAGKRRGIGAQPSASLRSSFPTFPSSSDAVALKTHPVVIVERVEALG